MSNTIDVNYKGLVKYLVEPEDKTVVLTFRSPVSGEWDYTIPFARVTPVQLTHWAQGSFIQNAAPNLTPTEREFFLSGFTESEQEGIFAP